MAERPPSKCPISSHEAVTNLVKYSDTHDNLLRKYEISFFLSYFDRYTIEELQQKMGQRTYTQNPFVREIVSFILHPADQTLFLVLNTIELYKKIINQHNKSEITIKDFTQHLCSEISKQESFITLHTKEIPCEPNYLSPTQVRDIDINAALVYSLSEKQSPRICKANNKIQKRVDSSKPLHLFRTNRTKKQLITLGRLASHINIYDLQLRSVRNITPQCFKMYNRNAAILDMDFSEQQQRIGCIITHTGLAFWDYEDQFATEKLIKKVVGDKIYFLTLLNQWVTTTHNEIHLWDLKQETIKRTFGEPNAIAINDIEEISHLRSLAVSYTMKDQFKWIYIYKNDGFKIGSRMKVGHVGAQQIHYHKSTQTLLLLGNKNLVIYQIDQFSFDLSLLKELEGHATTITAITDLDNQYVLTGDDRGTLRIWDLNNFRCQQVLKVTNSLSKLDCLDSHLILADSRLNIMQLEQLHHKIAVKEQIGIAKYYILEDGNSEIFIFTNVSCRVYSLQEGRIKRVIELCSPQQEITAVQQIKDHFIISTSRSLLLCYSKEFELKWKMNSHQLKQEILHIKADTANNFFATASRNGNIQVWNQQKFSKEGPRKSILNNDKKGNYEIALFDLSEKYGVMVTGEKNNNVKIWDYQSCKLCHMIETDGSPCALKVADKHPLLAIGCPNEKVYLYKLTRRENLFEVTFLQYGHLRYPQLKLNSLISVDSATQFNNLNANKRMKQTKIVLSQGIVFFHKDTVSLMAVSYGRGNVLAYDISELETQNFTDNNYSRRMVNIERPVKEYLEKQISKNQYQKTQKITDRILQYHSKIKVGWNKKIHNDVITHIDACRHSYFSTLALDGYLKIGTVDSGEVVAVLSISDPLPSLWKLELKEEQQICNKVHQALIVISNILADKDTTEEEKRIFNIVPFMKMICTKKGNSALKKRRKSVRLLKDQRNNLQKQLRSNQESLKSMETFRRVSLIRENAAKITEWDFKSKKKYFDSLKGKSEIIKLLSPYHFGSRRDIEQEEQNKFSHMITKSAQISPTLSPEKHEKPIQKENKVSSLLELINKKAFKNHPNRSLSQKLESLSPFITNSSSQESSASKQLYSQLKAQEPLKTVSNFLKALNNKIPKQHKMKSHLKKTSSFIPKF